MIECSAQVVTISPLFKRMKQASPLPQKRPIPLVKILWLKVDAKTILGQF